MQQKKLLMQTSIASGIRAISGNGHILVGFGYGKPHKHLILLEALQESNLAEIRGEADKIALWLRYHNKQAFTKYAPKDEAAFAAYHAMERARVEAIGANLMKGVKSNIAKIMEYDDIYLNSFAKFTNQMIGNNRIAKLISPLFDLLEQPEAFAKYAAKIAHQLSSLKPHEKLDYEEEEIEVEEILEDLEEDDDEPVESKNKTMQPGEQEPSNQDSPKNLADIEDRYQEAENQEQVEEDRNIAQEITASYQIFTEEFDEVTKAEELANIEELSRLEAQLIIKMAKLGGKTKKLAAKLQNKLLSKKNRNFHYNFEDGILDPKKLAILIADPVYPSIYRRLIEERNINTVVSLLIDNSGSMRGRPITVAAISALILAIALEKCGVKVEVLGYTSADWKGGKSRKKWVASGAPENPGRLNDLRHIIYKSADKSLKKCRRNFGLMLKDGILKENIDGEALLWSYKRLITRPEPRKILMVISDGAPVDDSTLSANNAGYLEQHLKEVIARIEKTNIELFAIGIGHDVARYYKKAVTIKDVNELDEVMFKNLAEML